MKFISLLLKSLYICTIKNKNMALEKSFETYKIILSYKDIMPYGIHKGRTIEWLLDNEIVYLNYCCLELELQVDNEVYLEIQEACTLYQ